MLCPARETTLNAARVARRTRAAAVAAVVQQLDGVIGKRAGQAGRAVRDSFRVAAEVDERALGLPQAQRGALQRTDGDDQQGAVHRQCVQPNCPISDWTIR